MADEPFGRLLGRFGYALSIGFQILLLIVVNNILEWGWFPWLTDAWTELVPLYSLAIVVNIVQAALFIVWDHRLLKRLTQVVVNALSVYVLWRTLQVFPFDFSSYEFPFELPFLEITWDGFVRFVLAVAVLATSIALVVELGAMFRGPTSEGDSPTVSESTDDD